MNFMKKFVTLTFRSILLVATLISMFIVLPAIFAINSILMFPLMALAIFGYAIAIYWQGEWFVGNV